ncbi:hypothetical protein SEA_ZEINA_88 [Arthrobacter phage Zeina]|nr:hypothetical protein SEA_ZEINA_88 [Arthrobacter phage Zeina]
MTEKIMIDAWQMDYVKWILGDKANAWLEEHVEVKEDTRTPVPNVYIFYGEPLEMAKWSMDNAVPIRDVVLATEWNKLQGRRAYPRTVSLDRTWTPKTRKGTRAMHYIEDEIHRLTALYKPENPDAELPTSAH